MYKGGDDLEMTSANAPKKIKIPCIRLPIDWRQGKVVDARALSNAQQGKSCATMRERINARGAFGLTIL